MDNIDLEIEEQHPIPQQISSYQFRLVGDMTLKQFFQVAGGAIVSIVLYSTNLPAIIKWPLIFISFLLGIALAFFPLANRPLAAWIFAFFKTIYSPTIYKWKEINPKISFYQDDSGLQKQTIQIPQASVKETKVSPTVVVNPNLENMERNFLSKIQDVFKAPTITVQQRPQTDKEVPGLGHVVSVPIQGKVGVEATQKTKQEETAQIQQNVIGTNISPIPTKSINQAQRADFIPEAAPPAPSSTPNVVVGQVLDTTGKIIDNAILEIRDESGRPVRALKSNKLGHFMIVTPLANGKYEIVVEKENYNFSPVYFFAKGEIVPSIRISGKPLQDNKNQANLNSK